MGLHKTTTVIEIGVDFVGVLWTRVFDQMIPLLNLKLRPSLRSHK